MERTKQLKMNKEIEGAKNLGEIFKIVGKYYDLENSKPGFIAKGIFISKLPALVTMLSAKEKI